MIKFNIVRTYKSHKPINNVYGSLDKNKQKVAKQVFRQVNEGLSFFPIDEYQIIMVKLKDKPIKRFFAKLLNSKDANMPVDAKVVFQRVFKENDLINSKRISYQDTLSYNELQALKKGENLVNKKGSFLNNLVNKINNSVCS